MNGLLSIDLETTGLDDREDQVLEIGAAYDPDGRTPIEDLMCFRCLVKHPQIKGQPYALQMNNGLLRILAGVDKSDAPIFYADEAIERLAHWVRMQVEHSDTKVSVAGKNFGSFDRQFLRTLSPVTETLLLPMFHHRVFDPGSMYWIPEEDGFVLPDLKKCLKRIGLEPTGLHTAVGDAIDVIRLIRAKLPAPSLIEELVESMTPDERTSLHARMNGHYL